MRGLNKFFDIPGTRFAAGLVLILTLLAAVGPLFLRDPNALDLANRLGSPGSAHPFGTDQLGRDILSRLVAGGRVSLLVGVTGTLAALVGGVIVGGFCGFGPVWLDNVVMRVNDVLISFPFVVVAIALAFVLGPNLKLLIVVIAITQVPTFIRIARSSVLAVSQREFVLVSRSLGRSTTAILFRHILPNAMGPVLAFASLSVGTAINIEAGLSFIGAGVQPPTASWGTILSEGSAHLRTAPWITLFAGVTICVAVLAFTILGEALRTLLDHRGDLSK
jgi:peptide/nickel transport system permease protein